LSSEKTLKYLRVFIKKRTIVQGFFLSSVKFC